MGFFTGSIACYVRPGGTDPWLILLSIISGRPARLPTSYTRLPPDLRERSLPGRGPRED